MEVEYYLVLYFVVGISFSAYIESLVDPSSFHGKCHPTRFLLVVILWPVLLPIHLYELRLSFLTWVITSLTILLIVLYLR